MESHQQKHGLHGEVPSILHTLGEEGVRTHCACIPSEPQAQQDWIIRDALLGLAFARL